jgi:hypothetical protein
MKRFLMVLEAVVLAAMGLSMVGCAQNNCTTLRSGGGPITLYDSSYKGPSSQSQVVSPTTTLPSTAPSGSLDASTGTKMAPQATATTPAQPVVILPGGTVVDTNQDPRLKGDRQ